MINIPGYTLRGAIQATGTNLLFHAMRDADGLLVILKTPMAPSPGPRERERYRREFGILQRLQDVRGVPRVHGCEQLQDRPVLLLEAIKGSRLSQLTGKPLEVPRVLELGIALASILAELHHRGIVHKDLKPSNIIVMPSGEPRLIDFGTASLQLVEHVDALHGPLLEGTLPYLSPEQTGRMNRSVDHRTDFYSLGITLYELLTGSRPFQGRDALEWIHAHMAQAPQPPIERVKELPPVLSAIVLKLLAKVAEERYQSAEGLRADLERCRESLSRGAPEAFVPGMRDLPTRFQLPQRLYGRDTQAATLLQGFERVLRNGRPELILVRGYSGIGKSSVVNELHKPVVRQHAFFLGGKFDQFQRDVPYSTLAQAIRGLTQQLLSGTDEELARWRELLNAAWAGQGQVLVDVVPQLEFVAGPQPPAPPLPHADAQARFNKVFRGFLGVFATAERPLVVFLDDLQWADLASLRLLQHLLTHPDAPPVLWIGAYRDNEVSASHPLALTLVELYMADARMTELQLEPLSLEEVRRLVADALPGADERVVAPLAELAREKTGGNPFFLLHFLRTLHQDGLLTRTPQGSWRWEAEGVRAKGYSDNVVDFMVGKLRQLPARTQHLLRLAACVGNGFSLRLLALISHLEDASEVEQGLEPALQEGLLTSTGAEQYRFLHDRIQQAAYALIPVEERKAIHLSIGRLLLTDLPPEMPQQPLFDVVSQLNAGLELLREPVERHRVALLNAEAGRRAQASTAFRSAAAYLSTAFQLLPDNPWDVARPLAFQLRLDQATCEFMSGQAAEARRLVEELRPQARTRAEMVAFYRLKNDLHIAASEIQAALDSLLEGLALLGMPMPAHPTWEEVVAANDEVWQLLGERPIESLVELPRMTAPDMEAVMSLLAALYVPAYLTDRNLLILHLCRLVSLSLRHGNSAASIPGYSSYGAVLGPAFKRYREGHAFGQLACELVERHGLAALRGAALYSMEMICCFTRPLSVALELIRRAFHHAVQASDFQTAGYCCNHVVTNRLALGHELEEVYQESVARLDFASKAGFLDVRDVVHFTQRYVQQLRGLTPVFGSLNGEGFSEESFEATLATSRMSITRCWYWIIQMQARYLSGAYAQAREAGARAAELSWASTGHIQLLDFHLFRALTLAACFARLAPEEQGPALELIQRDHQQLVEWVGTCPETFRAPERLVFAELARVTGREAEAFRAYEEALQAAREHGLIQYVALASELAARFWFDRRMPTLGETYGRKAREAWSRWGAHGKARQLEGEWPDLATPAPGAETFADTDSMHIDALTVVKAQQAISGEMVLERLADTLLRVAIENAGAQRGVLLLPRDGKLSVVAVSGTAPEVSTAGSHEDRVPWSVISYVRRTRENVLLGDASQPHPFSEDEWLQRGRPRSVLCVPLVRQEEFRGVLYLENGLATNAFTPARGALLGHLASQAAISLENARLYTEVQRAEAALRRANDGLEKRVEERTRELREVHLQLVQAARRAGMAEIATNVLHNVGNVLNSVYVASQLARERLEGLRVEHVGRVAHLLHEHQNDIGTFLSQDERGRNLLPFMRKLGENLLEDRQELLSLLEDVGRYTEHIGDIVKVQQNHARPPRLEEPVRLVDLVEDALRINLAALTRHHVKVVRYLAPLPAVLTDKHKTLMILVNLISNAKYAMDGMPPAERILTVKLERVSAERAHIVVQDNGKGIPSEMLTRIFQYGFTTRAEGHGFGLHSSALAAQELGGSLTVHSGGTGHGATFTLELPFLPAEEAAG